MPSESMEAPIVTERTDRDTQAMTTTAGGYLESIVTSKPGLLELLLVAVCVLSVASCCVGCVVFACVCRACRRREAEDQDGFSRLSVNMMEELRFQMDTNLDMDLDEDGNAEDEGLSRTDTNDRSNEELYKLTFAQDRKRFVTGRPPPRISRHRRTPAPPPRRREEEEKQEEIDDE